jgi:hypothetical protein
MTVDTAPVRTLTITQIAARIAVNLFVMFPVLVIALYFLETEFDPSW